MYYRKEYLTRAHREIDTIFRVLFPEHGMAVREEQILLCHEMLDNLLGRNIALCDAGVGIGKTYAYLVACVLMRKYSLLADGYSPYEQRPVVISTSSIALQKAILTEYIPFLSRILQENGTIQSPIKAVIRKGKEHFVCDERLEQRIVAIKEKNKNALQKEALLSLKEHYDMDEVSGLSGFDRRMVSVSKFCSRECPKKGSCRYQQYLEHSRDDEMFIQICNHNYLLADGYHRLQDYRPLLKDYRALIVDEAHKLPDAAKQMFGKSLCYDDIREICFYLGKEYQGPEIRKLSGTIRMVLDVIGENHRTRYGLKEEFYMTEECDYVGKPFKGSGVYAMLRRLERKTGIKASPHMLRHYFANARRKDGWKLEMISQALGHRNIETTMKYLNITEDELIEVSDAFYNRHQAMYGVQNLL